MKSNHLIRKTKFVRTLLILLFRAFPMQWLSLIHILDSMFTYHPAADDELPIFSTGMIGQYAHGNEPSHHVIYLFNAIGHENRTQEYVAKVDVYKRQLQGRLT